MANHSNILAWKIPWTEEPSYSPWGHKESDTTEQIVHGILQARILENKGKSLSLFQGIFPTQGSNSGLPHCRWILYQLRHKGSPIILEWVACSLSSRFLTQELNQGLLHCRQILYQLSYQGSPIMCRSR